MEMVPNSMSLHRNFTHTQQSQATGTGMPGLPQGSPSLLIERAQKRQVTKCQLLDSAALALSSLLFAACRTSGSELTFVALLPEF